MKPVQLNDGDARESARPEQPHYWRSLADRERTDPFREALAREFPEGGPEDVSGVSRRRFLQLMGASVALAGASACTMPREHVLPFARRPEGRVPGEAMQYATCIEFEGVALPLVLTSNDGRPTKVEGNAEHPSTKGATTAQAQAAVLEVYDPDRSRGPLVRRNESLENCSWEEIRSEVDRVVGELGDGSGVALVTRGSSSPSVEDLHARALQAHPQLTWCAWESLARENTIAGAELAFGTAYEPVYSLTAAKRIVALDADFLVDHPDASRLAREFTSRRDPDGEMNRLYSVESTFSNTGGMADHRLPLRSELVHGFLVVLEQIATGQAPQFSGAFADPATRKFLEVLGKDLRDHARDSVVIVGERQPAHVHAIAHRLNAKLGSLRNGGLVQLRRVAATEARGTAALAALSQAMQAGRIQKLIVLDSNPVYDAPVDLGFAAAMGKVPTKLHVGGYRDETAQLCDMHVPLAHAFEAWGDGRTFDGHYCLQQPQIRPIWYGMEPLELLARIAGSEETDPRKLVQRRFAALANSTPGSATFEARWARALHDGFDASVRAQPTSANVRSFESPEPVTASSDTLELVFLPDGRLRDGRFANNSWLQETPDFVSKLTWDNALLIGPATAKKLGVENETMVRIRAGDRELEVAALIQPGQAPGSLALALGNGRTEAGVVGGSNSMGVAPAGFNANLLRERASFWHASDVQLTPTNKGYLLASTQDHFAIDDIGMSERENRVKTLIREADLEHYKEHPEFAEHVVHHPKLQSLWDGVVYEGEHQWGMAIDLNKCTGCNACVVACTSENNVPVVGKEQVLNGREMHWLRIDRYFAGDPEDPSMVHQPIACVHCENAPCEQVCPVAATTHGEEGTNDMAYNRCVGTRYCANNCPYKVRRFNYFNYFADYEKPKYEVAKLKFNPEVTVRHRGVMEKCTYCIQRIKDAGITARNEERKIRDGEVQSACQQSCPTNAIVFGDISEEDSAVSKLKSNPRDYAMLAELNVRPRTSFLAKVHNTHPDLPSRGGHGQSGSKGHGNEGHGTKGEKHG